MKKTLLLCLTFCISLWANAQATDLVVDCQTPGWLSSKINYGDQQTVNNLKVTGYINETDLHFIGTLFGNNLNGILDLGDANVVGNSWTSGFGVLEPDTIAKLILPRNLTSYKETSSVTIEYLVFDTQIKTITRGMFDCGFLNLIIGENVEVIEENGMIESRYNESVKSIHFPSSLKSIGTNAFNAVLYDLSTSNISVFPNLESIGSQAFVNTINTNLSNKETLPDTIRFPKIIGYAISAFDYKKGMHIYLGEEIQYLSFSTTTPFTNNYPISLDSVTFHIASVTPPVTGYDFKGVDVYVPKEAVSIYKDAWKNANILAEPVPLERIEISNHEISMEVEETKQLTAMISPENADNKAVSWSSSDDEIAIVDANGIVSALKAGEAWVKAVSVDNPEAKDSCKVTVKQPVTSITLSQTSATITKGATLQLMATAQPADATNKTLVWRSSDENVCVTTQMGLLIAMNEGAAVVTVVPEYGVGQAQCNVTVQSEIEAIQDVYADDMLDTPCYDMMGRKVSRLVKGRMYISNGKKIVAK